MKILTLPLKKAFFYQILSGDKYFEYRADTPFYNIRISKKLKKIIFHFYKKDRLECEVIKVDKIKNPFLEKKLPYLSTKKVFRIHLKKPKLIRRPL